MTSPAALTTPHATAKRRQNRLKQYPISRSSLVNDNAISTTKALSGTELECLGTRIATAIKASDGTESKLVAALDRFSAALEKQTMALTASAEQSRSQDETSWLSWETKHESKMEELENLVTWRDLHDGERRFGLQGL